MAEIRRMRPLLGTYVEVGVHAADGVTAAAAADAAFAAIERAQVRWSFHDPRSELSRLNRAPGQRVAVSKDTLRLLRLSRVLMRSSEGAFDCTVGGLLVDRGALPDHGGPPALPRGSADDIEVGDGWASLRKALRLTFDGIAKGFAIDLAVTALRRHGADAGWVNAGGDLRAFGDLTLPVHRRELDGAHTPLGGLRDAALASSAVPPPGATQDRSFPGLVIGHTDDAPAAGIWTVLARSAWRADALTKVAACTPGERRAEVVAKLGGQLVGAPA